MSPATRTATRRFLLSLCGAALLFPAVSCTSLTYRISRAAKPGVSAALESVYREWRRMPPENDAYAAAHRTRWRISLDGLLRTLQKHGPPQTWTGTQFMDGWTVTFAGDPAARLSIPPSWCDRIMAAAPAAGARRHTNGRTDGTGLPVVMVQRRTKTTSDPFFPPNGRRFPATLTVDFSDERKATLTFHHSRNVDSVRLRGHVRPLAGDLPAAIDAAMGGRALRKYAFSGLLRPDVHLKDAGIYTPEPFDPRKIPLVLVHGFESAPHIWKNVMRSVAADPVLRRHYQVWYFLYPSGLSIHVAAASLRESLQKAHHFYNPGQRHPAVKRMVIAGHSMGGLLARMQVIDSRSEIYRAFFTVPFDKLPLGPQNRDLVKRTLYFEHLPFVKRVVFIATPHGGSDIAELSVIRFVSRVIQPTKLITGLFNELSAVAHYAINPRLHRFRDFGSRSTEGLSPGHPLLTAIGERPILVPWHNLISIWWPMSLGKTLENSTDGAVTYRSAWLPGAESTTVVQSFHACAETPAVANALKQILHRHLTAR
jgi:hypothetical protein